MMKRFNKKENLGITLIALVVTIIILLILTGVTIGFAMNGTGLFEKAKLATDKYNNKVQEETIDIQKNTNEIDNHLFNYRENGIQPVFINTNNKLATIIEDTAYNNNGCTYTATENCIIVGWVYLHINSEVTIAINDVAVGAIWNDNLGSTMTVPINYLIAKGDTFKIINNRTTGQQYKMIYAYGIK